MEIVYTDIALSDIEYWRKSGNKQIQRKISELLKDIVQHPEKGIGKPEQLKHDLTGRWSRRIDQEHRIIYKIIGNKILISSLKGHY